MATYTVTSCNFSYHPALPFSTFQEALAAAKARGFEARIDHESGELVATWSPLYGVKTYSYSLATQTESVSA